MTFKFTTSFLLFLFLVSLVNAAVPPTLTVTVNRKAGQPSTSPVVFVATFSAAINVATFTANTIVLSGTATGKKVTAITQVSPNNGTTFEVTVTATSGNGTTIIASIPAAITTSSSSIFSTTGNNPSRMKIDGAGNLYVANYDDNNVSKITTTGVSSILGSTGAGPIGIVLDNAGNVYTSNYTGHTVSKITAAGVSTLAYAQTDKNPMAITIDGSGNLFTANAIGTVSKITTAGKSTIAFGNTGLNTNLTDIVTDASGNVYAANDNNAKVSKITAAGVTTAAFGSTGLYPYGITIDASGNLYTTNQDNNTISKITAAGVSTQAFSTSGTSNSTSQFLTIDGSGNIYTPNLGDNNVSKITPAGVSTIVGTAGNYCIDVALDAKYNLYVLNQTDKNITKVIMVNGIALSGSSTPSNQASTSSNNTYVLPITLLYFKVINNNCFATVNWQTASEINNSYYGIETSTDAITFKEAVKIVSKNSATGATYLYAFNAMAIGTTYYRLKIMDVDGTFTYSPITAVTANGNCGLSTLPIVSPNPAKDFVIVRGILKGSHLTLINAAGVLISSIEATVSTQRINMNGYANGIYVLRIEPANGTIQFVKIVKQ